MTGDSPLKVFLAGRVAVETDGVVIDEDRFQGRQGRLFFAYLVAEQGRAVPRDELAEALWGRAPPASWDKSLTVIASKLRNLLAEHGIDGANALTGAERPGRGVPPVGRCSGSSEMGRANNRASAVSRNGIQTPDGSARLRRQ